MSFKRCLQIFFGSLLVLLGIVMIFTPGQGLIAIVGGVMLISPYHGRRLVWHIRCAWRKCKRWFYSFRFKRTIKRRIIQRIRRLKKRIKP